MSKNKLLIGTGIVAAICIMAANLQYAYSDYGIKTSSLHSEVLAQASNCSDFYLSYIRADELAKGHGCYFNPNYTYFQGEPCYTDYMMVRGYWEAYQNCMKTNSGSPSGGGSSSGGGLNSGKKLEYVSCAGGTRQKCVTADSGNCVTTDVTSCCSGWSADGKTCLN